MASLCQPHPPAHPAPAPRRRPWADLSYLKRVAGHRTVPVERGSNYLATDFDEQARAPTAPRLAPPAPPRPAPPRPAPPRPAPPRPPPARPAPPRPARPPARPAPPRPARPPAPPRPAPPARPPARPAPPARPLPTPRRVRPRQLMSLEQFIETHIERRGEGAEAAAASGPTAYLAQHRLFEQVPRLREDIQLPDYCALSTSEEEEQTEEEVRRRGHRTRARGPRPCPRPRPSPERQLSRRPAPSPSAPAAATFTPPRQPAPRRCP